MNAPNNFLAYLLYGLLTKPNKEQILTKIKQPENMQLNRLIYEPNIKTAGDFTKHNDTKNTEQHYFFEFYLPRIENRYLKVQEIGLTTFKPVEHYEATKKWADQMLKVTFPTHMPDQKICTQDIEIDLSSKQIDEKITQYIQEIERKEKTKRNEGLKLNELLFMNQTMIQYSITMLQIKNMT